MYTVQINSNGKINIKMKLPDKKKSHKNSNDEMQGSDSGKVYQPKNMTWANPCGPSVLKQNRDTQKSKKTHRNFDTTPFFDMLNEALPFIQQGKIVDLYLSKAYLKSIDAGLQLNPPTGLSIWEDNMAYRERRKT